MPLALVRRRPHPATTAPPVPPVHETDLDRILKLIPTELVAFYAAAVPILGEVPWRYFALTLFLSGTALVPLILYLDGRSTGQAARWPQYTMRTLAFMVWAMAVGWPFAPWVSGQDMGWWRSLAVLLVPFVGAVLLRERPLDVALRRYSSPR